MFDQVTLFMVLMLCFAGIAAMFYFILRGLDELNETQKGNVVSLSACYNQWKQVWIFWLKWRKFLFVSPIASVNQATNLIPPVLQLLLLLWLHRKHLALSSQLAWLKLGRSKFGCQSSGRT